MSGEKYADKAVASLLAYYEATLPTYLRQVETDAGLSAGDLADPRRWVEGQVPEDNESPILEGDCETSIEYEGERLLHENACVVSIRSVSDADIITGQKRNRQYEDAMTRCLDADRTLGARVVQAVLDSSDHDVDPNVDSTSKYAAALRIAVVTWDG